MMLSEDQINKLIELRGGCECFVSAPCSACTDIPTDAELVLIGAMELPELLKKQAG